MKTFRWGITLLLAGTLFTQCWADVYVKNKLFKGRVAGTGSAVLVEIKPIMEALGVTEYEVDSGRLIIGESSVDVEGDLVSLKALADAVGASMVVNPQLGTVDIYQNTDKRAAQMEATSPTPAKEGYVPAAWGKQGVWLTSWDEAAALSKSSNKPIMINFTGSDWCGWCIRLKSEVFETEAFKSWAGKNVVLLEADFPRGFKLDPQLQAQNKQLAQQFQISGYPSIIFTDASGKQLGPRYGYAEGGPAVWTKQAEAIIKGR